LKKLLVILLSVLFMAACGAGNSEQTKGQGSDTNGSGIVAGEMVPSITEKSPLLFEYKVKNQTESDVTLEFTSSQRFDFSVENDKGEEIYLFSSVASFLQAMGEETVKPGEELVYEISLLDLGLEKGEYVLNAWMTPKEGAKYKVKTKFTVQ
jgi:ABC-type molybdate transport system substrate-binding protein